MPIIKSAKKRVRQAARRTEQNKGVKSKMLTAIKTIIGLVNAGKKEEAAAKLPDAYKSVDMAAKRNIIHKNKAARDKSRIAKAVA